MAGRYSVNVLPSPSTLWSWISPPSSIAISRLIERPRPVPPYLRRGRSVGLLERLEDDPVLIGRDSDSGIANRECDDRLGIAEDLVIRIPARFGDVMLIETRPLSVNLNAFDNRFFKTCCSRR